MKTFKEIIAEASLSRVWQHFESNETVIIFTAFRGDKKVSENINNNKKIAKELKSAGFGYFFVDGYWIENKDEDDERKVSEDSIFAISDEENSDKLIELAHKQANSYNQDAIFVKTKDEVFLYFKNGSKEKMKGGLKPGRIGDMYTKLRNNKSANTFVFEGVRTNYGFFGNLAASLDDK